MADAAIKGQGAERGDPPNVVPFISPLEDGGVEVNFDGPPPEQVVPLGFGDNLTSLFTDQQLQALGHEIVQLVDEDDRSRDDWKRTYARARSTRCFLNPSFASMRRR
jgi:hypothetical protein